MVVLSVIMRKFQFTAGYVLYVHACHRFTHTQTILGRRNVRSPVRMVDLLEICHQEVETVSGGGAFSEEWRPVVELFSKADFFRGGCGTRPIMSPHHEADQIMERCETPWIQIKHGPLHAQLVQLPLPHFSARLGPSPVRVSGSYQVVRCRYDVYTLVKMTV